jgi:signal peptidase II
VADLATKAWAKAALSGFDTGKGARKRIEVIPDSFDFIYTLNPGGAWSFLRTMPESLRRPFFLFVSAAAIVFIVSVYGRVHRTQTAMKWGLPLALGGAAGNLVDRVRFGAVIDFIDLYVVWGGQERHWPTFNVADIAIVLGVLLMGVDTFISSRRARRLAKAGALAAEPLPPGPPSAPAEASLEVAAPAPPAPAPPPA